MRDIVDVHVHIDKFVARPDGKIDFSKPPETVLVPEEVVEQMDNGGVGKAVIMQHPTKALNDEVAKVIKDYPGRFRGAMIIELEEGKALAQLEENFKKGLDIVKFEMFGTMLMYPDLKLDSPLMEKVYAKAQELGIVVVVDPHKPGVSGYQPKEMERMIKKYPDLTFVVLHMGFPSAVLLKEESNYKQWKDMISLAEYENVWFEASAMPDMYGDVEEYPYPSSLTMIREFIDKYGPKIMWGSDILGMLGRASYRDLIDIFEKSDIFTDGEKDLIFSENAMKVYYRV